MGRRRPPWKRTCVSEGWIRVAVGKTVDRKGNPLTLMMRGKVEPYFRTDPPQE